MVLGIPLCPEINDKFACKVDNEGSLATGEG